MRFLPNLPPGFPLRITPKERESVAHASSDARSQGVCTTYGRVSARKERRAKAPELVSLNSVTLFVVKIVARFCQSERFVEVERSYRRSGSPSRSNWIWPEGERLKLLRKAGCGGESGRKAKLLMMTSISW